MDAITLIVIVDEDRRLQLDIDLPPEWPVGPVKITISFPDSEVESSEEGRGRE